MSTDSAELRKLVKQLQHTESATEILDILKLLKKGFHVNESILRETKAGLAVGKLRSNKDKSVADAAKELVKKWRNDVDKAKQGSSKSPATPVATTVPAAKRDIRTAKSDGVTINFSGDKTRDKCAELIYDALAMDSDAASDKIAQRAKEVEIAVFNIHAGATADYKSKIRTLIVNLKDKNNPTLRERVVRAEISADRFSKMSSAEMASDDRKAADEKIKADNLFASLGAGEQQAETDAFQCGRCKQRKCRYRQAQTRSADEPMTTFVTCTNCGHRWKFS